MAAIFLTLIIVPSGLLGYFNWLAIQNEKRLAKERLRESYGQFARLAAREIDTELKRVEKRWTSRVNSLVKTGRRLNPEQVEQIAANEPLILAGFLLSAPGQVALPRGISLGNEGANVESLASESYATEYEIFDRLKNRGEDFEYGEHDLDQAIATYGQILARLSNSQLRAMAKNFIGRATTKKGDWENALAGFRDLLETHPEERDVNKMYLRFVAQYQIAVCLENLDRDQEAVEALLTLNRDLLERSDTINDLQYSFFLDQIKNLTPRLLSSPRLTDSDKYEAQFTSLAEQNKKRLSEKYFLQLLDRQLSEMVIERKYYRETFRYVADETEADEPFLLAYQGLPDPRSLYISGLVGMQIDLKALSQRLFPAILSNLELSAQISVGINDEKGTYVIGSESPNGERIAVQPLAAPFDFWQVAIYLEDAFLVAPPLDFRTTLGLWLIAVLLLLILMGVYFFLRRAWRQAYLSQMKSSFVSNVSHELRTPLASINMLAELMEMQLTSKSSAQSDHFETKSRHYLSVIRRECGRLGRLIEGVLDFSKVERGVKQYNFEYEDPAMVLRRAVDTFRPQADAHGFVLRTEIDEDGTELLMDADAICQAVLNLISNAVNYSDEVKEIHVRGRRTGSHFNIEVVDRGMGMTEKEIPKIFDEFYRADQRMNAPKQGGIGLGLTLVHHIVAAHNGDISVQSEVGKGSTFTIRLPVPPQTPSGQRNGKVRATDERILERKQA